MSRWFVYILDCDGRFYTGITTDIERRLAEHRSGVRGARFTRPARDIELRYSIAVKNRSEASKMEAAIKKLARAQKAGIVDAQPGKRALMKLLQ